MTEPSEKSAASKDIVEKIKEFNAKRKLKVTFHHIKNLTKQLRLLLSHWHPQKLQGILIQPPKLLKSGLMHSDDYANQTTKFP